MFKSWIFPLKKNEWLLFGLMFVIVCLININFNILRSARNALVVADQGGSVTYIPYFELFGTFPASILLTWGISQMMRFFSFRSMFSLTMGFFLIFFISFAFWIYPHREIIQEGLENILSPFFRIFQINVSFSRWADLVFYILSELWKVALLSVLFWGFINQNLSLEIAKRFYPPLMLGSSVGAIIAGPITVFCTSHNSWNLVKLSSERWQNSLCLLTVCLVIFGMLTLIAFHALSKKFEEKETIFLKELEKVPFKRRLLSLSSSFEYLLRSPYLLGLLFIVIAEYVSYALGELIFLETLKQKLPAPSDYCQYLGNLTLWTGILTALSAVFVTPYILQKYRWSTSILLTPILMVLMTFAFFGAVYLGKLGILPKASSLSFIVFLGSMHFCLGRSTKYTIFDTTKELAFIPLHQEAQVKGKLVIDGIGSRLGRGASSLLSISLFYFVGGPTESALFAGILALCFAFLSLPTARFISHEFEKMQQEKT